MSLEPFIEGTYLKFNNNNGHVEKMLEASHSIMQTFSHFTYSYSNGMLMVTDLQGVVNNGTYKLTDPAIHTADPKKYLKDPTNLGDKGMSAFFVTHTCNRFCRELALKSPAELDTNLVLEESEAGDMLDADREAIYTQF